MYRPITVSVLLYELEGWSQTPLNEVKFRIFEKKIISKMYQPVQGKEIRELWKWHSVEIYDWYDRPDLIEILKIRKLWCMIHLGSYNRSIVETSKPGEKKPVNKTRWKWVKNEWSDDRVEWQSLVSSVKCLWAWYGNTVSYILISSNEIQTVLSNYISFYYLS